MRKYSHIPKIAAVFAIVLAVIAIVFLLTSCGVAPENHSGGYQYIDTVRSFDRVVAALPDGTVIKGDIDTWRDYEDGDQIQVTINGDTYLFHSSNIVLIKDR